MVERTRRTKVNSRNAAWLQRKTSLRIGAPNDAYEREADRAAQAVTSGRPVPRDDLLLSRVPVSAVQRDEKPKAEEEKYKEAAEKLGEAFLATELGKKLKEKAGQDPLVKGAKEAGESFIGSLPGKVITGAAAAGAVAALAATHRPLPAQLPEIPLDKITPGLKVKITYEGPVDKPTKAMISFSYSEQLGGKKKPAKTETERLREENAKMAAEQARFRAGLRYKPGSPEALRQQADDEAMRGVIQKRFGLLPLQKELPRLPELGGVPPYAAPSPFQLPQPKFEFKPKPFSLLDEELKLTPLGEAAPGLKEEQKKKEEIGIQRKASGDGDVSAVPPSVHEALDGAGQPLDSATRSYMEARFGRDFSAVRIHTDSRAATSADAVAAFAYTAGEHIVFAAQRYSPHTPQGRHLLAHELAHVVQQTQPGFGGAVIQRRKKPGIAPTKFYQYVIDAIADHDQRMAAQAAQSPFLVIEHLNYRGLKALLPLCEAVDQKRSADIPKLLDVFMDADIGFHLGTISRDLMIELAARMIELGLADESAKLRRHYAEKAAFSPGHDPGADRRTVEFFKRLTELAVAAIDTSTPDTTAASFKFLVRAFVPLRDAIAAIDYEALAWERRMDGRGIVLRPWMTRVEYYDALTEQLELLFGGGIEALLQTMIDGAATELENQQGSATLALMRKLLDSELRPALFPSDRGKDIASLRIPITRTRIKRAGHGTISDPFAKGKQAKRRTLPITTYDPRHEVARELHMSLERLYQARINQINVLARIYGAVDILPREKPFDSPIGDDAERNAETLKHLKGGRLRLHSDDDWREFVLQKYQDIIDPPLTGTRRLRRKPAEALHAVIDLLFAYLRAFTVHARYTNVYDIGDNYLNRDFPRALSGQLVHDCGVYALRAAYILSLVRNELKLRFRFVLLPAHIALVIDGDDLPAYLIHNDHYEELSAEKWRDIRKDWEAYTETKKVSDETGMVTIETEQHPPGPRDETQFIGEIASSSFISGPLDMPFVVKDVPVVGDDPKKAQRKLWDFYQTTATTKLFGPASEKKDSITFAFHNRYLAVTERMREMHNDVTLKFWNEEAPAAWAALEQRLAGDKKRSSIAAAELLEHLEAHAAAYTKALEPVESRLASIEAEQRSISSQVRDPKMRRKLVRLSYGPRAATLWIYYWKAYQHRLARYSEEIAKRAGEQVPLKEVRDQLKPPFIPVEKNRLRPLD